MKTKYFVFAFDEYYPSGGMDDLVGTFDTEKEALIYIYNDHVINVQKTTKANGDIMVLRDKVQNRSYYQIAWINGKGNLTCKDIVPDKIKEVLEK